MESASGRWVTPLIRRWRTEEGASATPSPAATRATRLDVSGTSWRTFGEKPAPRTRLHPARARHGGDRDRPSPTPGTLRCAATFLGTSRSRTAVLQAPQDGPRLVAGPLSHLATAIGGQLSRASRALRTSSVPKTSRTPPNVV
jgi:hypothetical protein